MALWGRKEEDKYNRYIRERVVQARKEKGITQEELARLTHRSRSAIANLEIGKTEINAVDLMGIAFVLEKPVRYFYPQYVPTEDDLSNKEWELIHHFRRIQNEAVEELAIKQVKQLADVAVETDIRERREVEATRVERVKGKK